MKKFSESVPEKDNKKVIKAGFHCGVALDNRSDSQNKILESLETDFVMKVNRKKKYSPSADEIKVSYFSFVLMSLTFDQ